MRARSELDHHGRQPVVARLSRVGLGLVASALVASAAIVSGCAVESSQPATPLIAGTDANPREVNLIARDYAFVPPALELIPGETVLLHVVNAGLVVHEAVIGGPAVQDAWEAAEAAVAGAPPGPTPVVRVAPDVAGIRVVARSGERVDVTFTVPTLAGDVDDPDWIVGCHIPGHFAKGMQAPVRWVPPQPAPGPSGS